MGVLSEVDQAQFQVDAEAVVSLSSIALEHMTLGVSAVNEGSIESVTEAMVALKAISAAFEALADDLDKSPLASASMALAKSLDMFIDGLKKYPDLNATSVLLKSGTAMYKTSVYAVKAGLEFTCGDTELGREMMAEAEKMREETGEEVTEMLLSL